MNENPLENKGILAFEASQAPALCTPVVKTALQEKREKSGVVIVTNATNA